MVCFDRRRFTNYVTMGLFLSALFLVGMGEAQAARKKVSVNGKMAPVANVLRDVATQAKVQLVMTSGVDAIIPIITIKNQP